MRRLKPESPDSHFKKRSKSRLQCSQNPKCRNYITNKVISSFEMELQTSALMLFHCHAQYRWQFKENIS